MKSRLLLLFFLIFSGITSLSCNRGIDPNVLRFWHFWSEPAQRLLMDSVVRQFKAENPGIPVEVTELSWSDGKTKLMIGFNSKTAPDVLELGSDWVPQFSSSGVLHDVGSETALKPRMEAAPEYSLESGAWQGKFYAVPWMLDTRVMFINDSLAALAGYPSGQPILTDWNAMMEFGRKVQAVGAKGVGVNGSDAHRLYKKFLPYIWSNGGDLLDANGKPILNSQANIEALRFYVEQMRVGVLETQKNLDDLFKRGQLGVWFSGSWMLGPMLKAPFKWHTELVPGNKGSAGVSFAGGEYLAINKESAKRDNAVKFVEFLTRPDVSLRFAKAVNMYPADRNSQLDSFYVQRREGPVFTAQLQRARMTPVIPQWLDAEAVIEDEVSRALYGKATPEEAMNSAQKRVEALMREP